ncbi:MAG TPA: hypothetical protein VJ910_01325 [Desulfuromonadales bacterium]|nr:hypothetical protein [Desulfuromonadales bacterium]
MDRFRVTFLAISAVLLFLGISDLELWWRNRTPTPVDIAVLATQGPPTEWLKVTDGYLDLDRAISTSGTIDIEALLVPLLSEPDQEEIRVLVETRQPGALELVEGYHFLPETEQEQQAFREQHAAEFVAQRDVTGMLVSGLIAKGNRKNLLELAQQTGLNITEDVIFISEGKVPQLWRGLFFTLIALFTILKIFWPRTAPGRKK